MCLLLVDAGFLAVVFRAAPTERRTSPVLTWLLAGPLLGGIVLARFDLVVGVLAGLAVLGAARRPRWAAAAVTLAAGLKLWPALVVPAVVTAARRRQTPLLVVVASAAVLAVATVVVAGPARLLSPLTYQADRGLQVESLAATPAIVAWALSGQPWRVHFAHSRSFEVIGPWASTLSALSTVASALLLVVLAIMWWRALRRTGGVSTQAVVWISLAAVMAYIVSAKVLSPQYLLWVLPVAVAGLAIAPTVQLRRWTFGACAVCLLTHVLYPWVYLGLVKHVERSSVAIPVLVVRNLGLVLLLAWALRNAWRATARSPEGLHEPLVRRSETSTTEEEDAR
jgi:hypothetical protein